MREKINWLKAEEFTPHTDDYYFVVTIFDDYLAIRIYYYTSGWDLEDYVYAIDPEPVDEEEMEFFYQELMDIQKYHDILWYSVSGFQELLDAGCRYDSDNLFVFTKEHFIKAASITDLIGLEQRDDLILVGEGQTAKTTYIRRLLPTMADSGWNLSLISDEDLCFENINMIL